MPSKPFEHTKCDPKESVLSICFIVCNCMKRKTIPIALKKPKEYESTSQYIWAL